MSSFAKPTITEIYETIINDYTTRTEQQVPVLKRALIKCFAYAIAGVVCFIWNFAEWQYLQIFIATCDFEALKRWGDLVNINYKTGTKTVLKLQLDNVITDTIQAGTIWKSLINGLTYKSISTVNKTNSSNEPNNNLTTLFINIECTESGTKGNILNNEILNLTNPIIGIPETATIIETITTGTDDEDIETYRSRVITRYKKKPQGGAAMDYYQWSLEVGGIVDCLPYVLKSGIVSLFIISDGSGKNRTPSGNITPNPFPSWVNGQPVELTGSGQFLSAAKSIDGIGTANNTNTTNDRRPINTRVQLLPPNYTGYKIDITGLEPYSNSVAEEIKNSITMELDKKRPNLLVLGYTIANATINSNQLSSIVQNILDKTNGSFQTFMLKDPDNKTIITDTLGIGELAYLSELKINGSNINI